MRTVTVVGSGVLGLTSAVALLRAGHRVHIVAREFAWRTTSAVAGAIWFPYEARPPARVGAWARTSLVAFERLAARLESAVTLCRGVVYDRASPPRPWWRELVPTFQPLPAAELPPGVRAGDRLVLPVAEMPLYLQFLVGEVQRLGGRIEQRDLGDLADAGGDVVVNCSGLGARGLAHDDGVYPIRGQVVSVRRVVDEFVLDDDHPGGLTYVIPRSSDCVLGGTAETGDADAAPRPEQTAAILARCAGLCPTLRDATVHGVRVGLRPGRATVRLEADTLADGRRVVHAYGHGGSGMTLSWGCAEEVVALIDA